MKQKIYFNDENLIVATTLKDKSMPDCNNMALHVSDNVEAIINNRKKLATFLNIPYEHMVFLDQTHSANLYHIKANDRSKGCFSKEDAIYNCDACYTYLKQVPIGIFSADCIPIILYDPTKQLIAAIHSGWAGTCKEILNKVLDHLMIHEQVDPKNLHAWIALSIEEKSFEVGMEVVEKFKQISVDCTPFIRYKSLEKAHIDHKAINKQILLNKGVLNQNIYLDHSDTMNSNDPNMFSYRIDKKCGRHFTYVMMK